MLPYTGVGAAARAGMDIFAVIATAMSRARTCFLFMILYLLNISLISHSILTIHADRFKIHTPVCKHPAYVFFSVRAWLIAYTQIRGWSLQ